VGLRNVPAPITTHLQNVPYGPHPALAVREPIPDSPLPGIEERLKHLAADQPIPSSESILQPLPPMAPGRTIVRNRVNRRASLPASTAQVPPQKGQPAGQSQLLRPSQRIESHSINMYFKRADAIGPTHHIPGIGHLGDLLTPPAWVPGSDPINLDEARKLYQQARTRARIVLDLDVRETKKMSTEEQEKQDAEADKKWRIQLQLDQLILSEREKIYKGWQVVKAKALQAQQVGPQHQHRSGNTSPLHPAQPQDPSAAASTQADTQHQQPQFHSSSNVYAPSQPLSGRSLNTRLQELQRGMYPP
jgi:hypothetical protein